MPPKPKFTIEEIVVAAEMCDFTQKEISGMPTQDFTAMRMLKLGGGIQQ